AWFSTECVARHCPIASNIDRLRVRDGVRGTVRTWNEASIEVPLVVRRWNAVCDDTESNAPSGHDRLGLRLPQNYGRILNSQRSSSAINSSTGIADPHFVIGRIARLD